MSVRTRIITLLSGVGTSTGLAVVTAAPAHAGGLGSLRDLLGGLPVLGLLSDREAKTDIVPVRWER
ncbi:hypothetical protein [Thermomonospora catenispora]|uniref:hypothetical protein n=1 Tax=Thermomonospora catenispora TaxID=2493090 RepID=UPI00112495FC|nr:hypothetical protein [Thermomonospora catenispora]TNY37483.1 hypothetical protein EIO00_08500 [Thermomonospora catenispora]